MDRLDAVVIGGGPAGATAARLLALWGHDVALITRPPKHTLGESLPPSTARLFREVGILPAVEAFPFLRSRGNTVRWAGQPLRIEPFAGGALGWQVERRDLDQLLLAAAEQAGVRLERDAVVDTASPDEPHRISYSRPNGERIVRTARWVLDCSGRAGVLARRGLRKPGPVPATFAMYAVWTKPAWDVPDETHTTIESHEDGWTWSIPVSASRRYVTAMLDPGAIQSSVSAADQYLRELRKAPTISASLHGAVQEGDVRGLSASPYHAEEIAGPGWLLVGDAASFIDPLSSYGVKKALASGWLAAVTINTCLNAESLQPSALDFYSRQERESFLLLSRQVAAQCAMAAEGHGTPFWTERAVGPDGAIESEPDPLELANDRGVRAAFDAIRAAPELALRVSPAVTLGPRPLVRGNLIVTADHVHSPWHKNGLRFLRGVNIPRMLELAPGRSSVPDFYEAYNAVEASVTLPDFIAVLSILVAKGILEPNGSPGAPESPALL